MSPHSFTIFEYLYRDASNYKVWGTLLLDGVANEIDLQVLGPVIEVSEAISWRPPSKRC